MKRSFYQLFFLLIVTVVQQTTLFAMDCPECKRHFKKSTTLINHYNKSHTNREFYLYAQDKDYVPTSSPKKSSKRTTKSNPKKKPLIKKTNHSLITTNNPFVVKQHPKQGLQERIRERILLEIVQQDDSPNNSLFFPEFSAHTTDYLELSDFSTPAHNLELFDFSTSAHNTDYLEWTEQ